MIRFIKKSFSPAIIFSLTLIACSTTKRINQAVADRKEQGVKVQFPAQGIATPADINMVYDYENLYTPEEEKKLDTLLRNFEKSNLIPIKLVTLKSANMQNTDFDANNAALYKEWDQVHGKNGKAMVVTISTEMRKSKVDYGPFTAKFITEAEIANIVEKSMPEMQQGMFYDGTRTGLIEMMNAIRKKVGTVPATSN